MGEDPWDVKNPKYDPTKGIPQLVLKDMVIDFAKRRPKVAQGLSNIAAEMERRQKVEAFVADGGLRFSGGARHQEWLLKAIKREMLRSPMFASLMFEIRADAQHPVEIKVGMNQPGVFVDGFDSSFTLGTQELDLADLARLPVDPPTGFPKAVTQGEVLVHALTEARAGALGIDGERNEYAEAHKAGIDAQNAYRAERGQQGRRRQPPDDGGRNAADNFEMRYDDGYFEVWVKGDTPLSIREINRSGS